MSFDEILAASHSMKGPLGATAFTMLEGMRRAGAPEDAVQAVEQAFEAWMPKLGHEDADTLVAVLQHRFEALTFKDAYTDLVRLKGQLTPMEAHIVHDALKQAGIPSRLAHERRGAAIIPSLENEVELWVRPSTLDAAQTVLANLKPTAEGTTTCPACKEKSPAHFAFCWSCGGPLGDEG